jgi:hypothetical protein
MTSCLFLACICMQRYDVNFEQLIAIQYIKIGVLS